MEKPKLLQYEKVYVMQIISADVQYVDFGTYDRNKIMFCIRAWPDKAKADQFVDFDVSFYDTGRAEEYLVEFIENATDYYYGDIGLDEIPGAVFKGIIKKNIKIDYYGCRTVFTNLNAIKHITYAEID